MIKRKNGRIVHKSYVPYTYLASIILNLFMALILALVNQLYPFGPNSLGYADGDQYFSFYSMLQRALLSGEDLFYTWNMVLGGNAMSMAAYYCMSPFNLLLVLFPHNLVLGVHMITLLKLLLSSVFFCMLLNRLYQGYFWEKPIFSAAYAYMGYSMAFLWNSSWLDGILILPLVLLGIIRLIQDRKPLLYILSIAYIIISNFYIGFMVCISSVIFYLAYIFYQSPAPGRELKHSILLYSGSSLLGGALSAPVLLTVLCNMPEGRRKPLHEILSTMHADFDLKELPSMFLTGHMNSDLYADNLPVIFIGIVFEVLLLLYFFNRKIGIRKKTVFLGLICIFAASFHNSILNTVWHGFSGNLWFNYRYSFVFSFILLLMAFESFRNADALRPKDLLGSLAVLVLTAVLLFGAPQRRLYLANLYLDLLIAGLTLLACWLLLRLPNKRKYISMAMCFLVLFNLLCNSVISTRTGQLRPYEEFGADFLEDQKKFREDMEFINDDSFYRMDVAPAVKRCPAALFGYKGVTNFASTENKHNLRFTRNLGFSKYACWNRYDANAPMASQNLLGLRYILSQNEIDSRTDSFRQSGTGHLLYENPDALSVIFPVSRLDNGIQGNPFENISEYYSTITGTPEQLFFPQVYKASETPDGDRLDYDYRFRTDSGNPLYLIFPEEVLEEEDVLPMDILQMEIRVNGQPEIRQLDRFERIHYLGTWPEGTDIELHVCTGRPFCAEETLIYSEDRAALEKILPKIEKTDLEELSSSRLKFEYELQGKEHEIFASTIPYDPAWTVLDNGRKVPVQKNWDNFLAFELDGEGSHEISLRYVPAGYVPGLILSAAAICTMVTVHFVLLQRRKKELMAKDVC